MNPTNDPLASLRDIHLPASISSWQLAPGWCVLIFLTIITVTICSFIFIKKWRQNSFRREALKTLNSYKNQFEQSESKATSEPINESQQKVYLSLSLLLKQVCLSIFPRTEIVKLSGDQWLAFLDEKSGTNQFSLGCGQVIGSSIYAPPSEKISNKTDTSLSELFSLCEDTIKNIQRPKLSVQKMHSPKEVVR